MNIRKPLAALLASLGLLSGGTALAAAAAKAPPVQHYVYFTLYSNLISRLAPRQDLLETQIDLDLQQAPIREALRKIFAQARQEYTFDGPLPEEKRITLRGKGMMLFEALDQLVRQAGGGWVQELRNGKPLIHIHRDPMPMTGHLPATPELLKEIAPLHSQRPSHEPTDQEVERMTVGQVAASGSGRNILGRQGIPSLTIP
jgi:hypothetical protein